MATKNIVECILEDDGMENIDLYIAEGEDTPPWAGHEGCLAIALKTNVRIVLHIIPAKLHSRISRQ